MGPLKVHPSCSRKRHPEQSAHDHIQVPFEYLQGGDCTASACTNRLHIQEALPDIQTISCVPLCIYCLSSWNTEPLKRAWLHPLCTFSSATYRHWWDHPLRLFFVMLSNPSSLPFLRREMLLSQSFTWPFIGLFPICPHLLYWEAQKWTLKKMDIRNAKFKLCAQW